MILVTGATGKIGSEVVRLLGPVRTLVRTPSGGADEVVGDFDRPDTPDAALRGVDTLVLIGPAVASQLTVLDRAAANGVRHVVRVTNHKAVDDSPVARRREHARIDAHLKASGMEYTLLAPNFFMQNLLALAPEIAATGGFSSSVGDGRIGMIDARDVAAAAATIATAPAEHAGRTYLLTGPELVTFADVAREWAAVTGRPVEYRRISAAEHQAVMESNGVPEAGSNAQVFELLAAGDGAWLSDDFAAVTGGSPRGLGAFLADCVGGKCRTPRLP
ncbi:MULTISPECIES: NmrA family NAD(P)-binding protein [unclassified Amycolatopsis]|uniref:NmrA family NAD(P)-binding protein n=1 Tax=unclassified Amycolatopsis TaxID=2618356 RepID=UPI001EE95628|nr:NmrA family NAD(P)-binding protein [Amycolatopsis sp. Poz14]MCG3750382.1 NmrA family NAD(P)-binding protein [Amycolatopsis sp. Poz14]